MTSKIITSKEELSKKYQKKSLEKKGIFPQYLEGKRGFLTSLPSDDRGISRKNEFPASENEFWPTVARTVSGLTSIQLPRVGP